MTEPGYYEFYFDNRMGKDKKSITFAIDVHNSTTDRLENQDIDPVERKIENIASQI